MRNRADESVLDQWYAKTISEDVLAAAPDEAMEERFEKKLAKGQKQTHEAVFNRLTSPRRGLPRIVDQPPLIYHDRTATKESAEGFIEAYRDTLPADRRILFDRYTLVDWAVKVVGVGSVGTRCYTALFLATPDDPLFLQLKEAHASVLEQYAGQPRLRQNGQRVVEGQRVMQAASDIFLGWGKGPAGRHFYVRQLRDMKIAPEIETQSEKVMRFYATLCGAALGRAHAKAGDAAMIAGYLGKSDAFDVAIGDYAIAYADQVERDYEKFAQAIRNGRLKSDLSSDELTTMLG